MFEWIKVVPICGEEEVIVTKELMAGRTENYLLSASSSKFSISKTIAGSMSVNATPTPAG